MMRALIIISLFAVIASKYVHQELEDKLSVEPGFSANRAIEVASESEFRSPMSAHEFVNRIKRRPSLARRVMRKAMKARKARKAMRAMKKCPATGPMIQRTAKRMIMHMIKD